MHSFYPPLSINALFYWYLKLVKATQKGDKLKKGCHVKGNRTRDLAHRRPRKLAIIISYPTSASGIIVYLKTPTKYRELFPTLFVKTTDFQLVFNFEQMRTVTIFGEHGTLAHIT